MIKLILGATCCVAVMSGLTAAARGDDWWHGFPPGQVEPFHRGYWQPGGFEQRIGSPFYYSAPYTAEAVPGDPYTRHFGAGFYRSAEYGHARFPYYSYRRPWFFPGPATYHRDTNFPW